jgi:hypothetical protein
LKDIVEKIVFLFGAGISIPAKIPSTETITNVILESKEIVRGSAENFYFDDPINNSWSLYKDIPDRVQSFLVSLKNEIDDYYDDKERTINYEDIFFLLDFIEYNFYQKEGNPAFKYLIAEFEPRIKSLLSPLDSMLKDSFDMNRLLSESKMLIKQVVAKLLSKKAESFEGLKFLNDSFLDNDFNSFEIFTLNHDIVLEQNFESKKIKYNDGFSKNEEMIDIWDPQLFDNKNKINLYKLHGSVNWQYYDQESWEDNRISKFPIDRLEKFDTISNALILIGTHNKMSDYIKDLYLELYYRLYKILNSCNTLVIAGYGFNDRGINQKIFNWLNNPLNNLVLIDPNAENIKFKFPSHLLRNWEDSESIRRIPHRIEQISWDLIKSSAYKVNH